LPHQWQCSQQSISRCCTLLQLTQWNGPWQTSLQCHVHLRIDETSIEMDMSPTATPSSKLVFPQCYGDPYEDQSMLCGQGTHHAKSTHDLASDSAYDNIHAQTNRYDACNGGILARLVKACPVSHLHLLQEILRL
jgi:hypothetical protein